MLNTRLISRELLTIRRGEERRGERERSSRKAEEEKEGRRLVGDEDDGWCSWGGMLAPLLPRLVLDSGEAADEEEKEMVAEE